MAVYLRAISYFREDARKLAALLLLIAVSTAAGLLQAWPVAVLVDAATGGVSSGVVGRLVALMPQGKVAFVAVLAGATLGLRLVRELTSVGRTWLDLRMGHEGQRRVRCELFQKLQALSIDYHRAQPQGDSVYRLLSDTGGCKAILDAAVTALVAALTLGIMTAVMLSQSVTLTLLALAVAPPVLATNVKFGRTMEARCTRAKEVESELTSVAHRAMVAIGLTQAFRRESHEYHRFRRATDRTVASWLDLHRAEVDYLLIIGVIFAAGGAAVLGYGGWLVENGTTSVGELTVFLAYLGMLYDPLCKLSGAGGSLRSGASGAARVFEVLDRDPAIADAPGALPLPPAPRTLTLSGVGFEYRAGHPTLDGVDATIDPGQMVAFVGASGVGKSTLLSLLPRFYDPTRGSLSLGGHDLRTVRLEDLRRNVALVLQDSPLMATTVAENIAYGRPGATRAEIEAAAELAGAGAFIRELPDGYDTRLLDGAQNLSGGQRQRIAIARALLTEAPIVVLDEPTSALDAAHERVITDTLRALRGRRTVIVVSHRLATVASCDRIFVMHGGRVVERGTHAELCARDGVYHAMAVQQAVVPAPDDEARALGAAPAWPVAAGA